MLSVLPMILGVSFRSIPIGIRGDKDEAINDFLAIAGFGLLSGCSRCSSGWQWLFG